MSRFRAATGNLSNAIKQPIRRQPIIYQSGTLYDPVFNHHNYLQHAGQSQQERSSQQCWPQQRSIAQTTNTCTVCNQFAHLSGYRSETTRSGEAWIGSLFKGKHANKGLQIASSFFCKSRKTPIKDHDKASEKEDFTPTPIGRNSRVG